MIGPLYRKMGPLGMAVGAAATPRWLSGGIAAADCLAAYEPLDAASLADSYVNLAHPGVNGATPIVAPALDASGWVFDGTKFLQTGVVPNGSNYSAIVRFSDNPLTPDNGFLFCASGGGYFLLSMQNPGYIWIGNGDTYTWITQPGIGVTSGVIAICGPYIYLNGININPSTPLGNLGCTDEIGIGAWYPGAYGLNGKIQRLYIYRVDISAQIVDVTAAINS